MSCQEDGWLATKGIGDRLPLARVAPHITGTRDRIAGLGLGNLGRRLGSARPRPGIRIARVGMIGVPRPRPTPSNSVVVALSRLWLWREWLAAG